MTDQIWSHPATLGLLGLLVWHLGQGAVAWYQARSSARLGVSGDARTAHRDALADRDEWIETITTERDDARARAATAEARDRVLADYAVRLRGHLMRAGETPDPWPDAAK